MTIPHKESVIDFLTRLSPEAQAIGAVNCIAIGADGQLTGHNTDWLGFWQSLQPLLQPQHKRALVFGTGGASKAVQYALQQNGIAFTLVSRSSGKNSIAYDQVTEGLLRENLLLINTTPLGMWPDVHASLPLPYQLLTARHLLYDLIYTPRETLFLQQGKAAGAAVKNGLEMLELQALESWRIWTEEAK